MYMENFLEEKVHSASWLKVFSALSESQKRWFAAQKAMEIGRGGIKSVSSQTGLARNTILRGIKELKGKAELPPFEQVRHSGGGRKQVVLDPETPLIKALEEALDGNTAGDPMKPLKWTLKSTRTLSAEMMNRGYPVSPMTIFRLLQKLGYSLRANVKTIEPGSDHPDREKQFQQINSTVSKFLYQNYPVISVDTKKKERIGSFKNGGKKWEKTNHPTQVNAYDFPSLSEGTAIPYGMYDVKRNEGMVNVGMNRDTAEFAVSSIQQWWKEFGKKGYPKAKRLLICCDGGGSNGSRSRGWKFHLQGFADKVGLEISVCHYPPGTSKWNKIEHRMFSFISMNWRGIPLCSYETVVNLIEGTTNRKGLKIKASLDSREYEIGQKISNEAMKELNVVGENDLPNWNYTVIPRGTKPSRGTKKKEYSTR